MVGSPICPAEAIGSNIQEAEQWTVTGTITDMLTKMVPYWGRQPWPTRSAG
jgi:hypothetical protein